MNTKIQILLGISFALLIATASTTLIAAEDCASPSCTYYLTYDDEGCVLTTAKCREVPPDCPGPHLSACPTYWCVGIDNWEECNGVALGTTCRETPGCGAGGGCGNKITGQCLEIEEDFFQCGNGIVELQHCAKNACCEDQ